jgi:uncharacterized protein YjbI with pentapeptide repeats
LLAVLSLAGCGNEVGPSTTLPGDPFTVTYEAGNGGGKTVTRPASNEEITLPKPDGFTAPDLGTAVTPMVFAGWNDGRFTYKDGYKYTVTGNVKFNARWGFTSKKSAEAYFTSMGNNAYKAGTNILLVAGDDGETSLTWEILEEMLGEIPATGSPTVELDLSASTLDVSGTADLSVQKLILSRDTTTITSTPWKPTAPEVSGLNVASIGYAFYACKSLTTADFPLVTIIDEYAFSQSSLTTVDFPLAETINEQAFYQSALNAANFPEVTTIESNAFDSCTNLKKANFPMADTIESNAFDSCTNLETANFPMAGTIGSNAFSGCAALDTADFPEATDIGSNAFDSCINLKKADFPKAKTIGDYAFSSCTNLVTADFSAAETIGEKAFQSCVALATITISKDCTINSNSGLPAGFITAYADEEHPNAAGTYTLDHDTWTFVAAVESAE